MKKCKSYLVEEVQEHQFDYTDAEGVDYRLYTEVVIVFKVVPGSFNSETPSDLDFRGYSEIEDSWIVSCKNEYGELMTPENCLTSEQLEEYNLDLINFIGG